MRYWAAIGVMVCWAFPAHAQGESNAMKIAKIRLEGRLAAKEMIKASVATGAAKACTDQGKFCEVEVEVAGNTDGQGAITCEAVAPNLRFPGTDPKNNPKRILWRVGNVSWTDSAHQPTPLPGVLDFHAQTGILLTTNPDDQIKAGTKANDSDENLKTGVFNGRNTHKIEHISGKEAAYFPVILHFPKNSKGEPDLTKPTLCGAPDPLITNAP